MTELYKRLDHQRRQRDFVTATEEEEHLLRVAAGQADTIAMYWLGLLCFDSDRPREGYQWLSEAATAQMTYAIGELATIDFWKHAGPGLKNIHLSDDTLACWRTAAEAGDYACQMMLADYGDKAPNPMSEAECLQMLLLAADQGYCCAVESLAHHFYHGIGMDQDYARAADLYWASLDGGRVPSYQAIMLAAISLEGQGVARNHNVGLYYLDQYAQHMTHFQTDYVNAWAIACYELGNAYSNGEVVVSSKREGMIKGAFWIALGAACSLSEEVPHLPMTVAITQWLLTDIVGKDYAFGLFERVETLLAGHVNDSRVIHQRFQSIAECILEVGGRGQESRISPIPDKYDDISLGE